MLASEAPARSASNTHQFYALEIPQTPSAALADVLSFEGTHAFGEPTRYVIRFTHVDHELSRLDFITKPASFVIQPPRENAWSAPPPERRVQGVITGFARLSSSIDESCYEVVLESRLALLRNTPKCRFFLDRSVPEILLQILKEHRFDQLTADFSLQLSREYPKHEFVMQWHEDDLSFIQRLCQRSGIWFVCETGKHCEQVRFGDDAAQYLRDASFTMPYQEYCGLETGHTECVSTLQMRATTISQRQSVRTYSPERATKETTEVASARRDVEEDATAYGEAYHWGAPLVTDDHAAALAELRHEAALATQVEFTGICDSYTLTPSAVLRLSNRELADAKHGLVVVSLTCRAARSESFVAEFTAIPSARQYRLPLRERTWPRIDGVVTGTIASPGNRRDPYLDDEGRYIVNLHFDRDERVPGLQSCPMRLAKPFGGNGQTGFHFGLVEGTVVTVSFLWGDPDLPYISQVLHTAQSTDPIVAGYPWSTRNTIRTRSNNTFQMEDREGQEHIKLATEHGKSQLTLGHGVNRENKLRGAGFELRSDLRGQVRAAGGVLVTADRQEKAVGEQADTAGATAQFALTQAQAEGIANAAALAKAEVADLRAENQWLKHELADLKKSVIALSAPNGIGLATPDRVMVSAGKDVSLASSSGFNVNALKTVAIAAGDVLSLFAHKLGIRLIAARGKVQIQAQSDAMDLVSQKNLQITSADGTATVNAANGVILQGGGSAYLKVHGDVVEVGGAGNLLIKMAKLKKDTPGSLSLPRPEFGQVDANNDERFVLGDTMTGRPMRNQPYKIELADGQIAEGVTNEQGETSLRLQDVAQGIKLLLQH